MPPTNDDDDEHFELDDLLWLIAEMRLTPSSPLDLLADAAERDIPLKAEQLADLLSAAQAAGLIEIWVEQGALVTLSALGAAQLCVHLSSQSDRWHPDWKEPPPEIEVNDCVQTVDFRLVDAEADAYSPGDEHRPAWHRGCQLDPSVYRDPTCPEPLDVMTASAGDLLKDGSRVKVHTVLGIRLAWPAETIPIRVEIPGEGFKILRELCPGCFEHRLGRFTYCALCHRAGVDGKFPPIETLLQNPGRYVHDEGEGILAGGLGTSKKKKKRKA
jgi:hypothetical protein